MGTDEAQIKALRVQSVIALHPCLSAISVSIFSLLQATAFLWEAEDDAGAEGDECRGRNGGVGADGFAGGGVELGVADLE